MRNAALLIQIAELNQAISIEFNTLFVDYALINHLRSLRDQLEEQIARPHPSDAQTQFRLWKNSRETVTWTIPSRRRPVSSDAALAV